MLGDGTHTYVYGHQRLLAVQGDTRIWHLADALGSLRMTLDTTGTPQSLHSYDAWGVVQEGTPSPVGFTGEVQQAGLVYLRARWYDPTAGTFLAYDPSRLEPHLYQYARNNPINFVDPSGLLCVGWLWGDQTCRPVWDAAAPGQSYLDATLQDTHTPSANIGDAATREAALFVVGLGQQGAYYVDQHFGTHGMDTIAWHRNWQPTWGTPPHWPQSF